MVYTGIDFLGKEVVGHELKYYPDGSLWIREENDYGYRETRIDPDTVREHEE